jgi:hypothetical protein
LPAGYATKPCTGVIHDATPNLEANAESFGNRPSVTSTIGWCMRVGGRFVKVGRELRFVPPDRVVFRRARAPGLRWAA